MCRRVSMAIGIALTICLTSAYWATAESEDSYAPSRTLTEGERQIVQSNNAFGFELFSELAARQPSSANLVVSPISIATELAMTANGADGDTRVAMRRVLDLGGMATDEVNRSCQGLNRYLEKLDAHVTFASAYSVWVDHSFELASQFRQISSEYFDAEATSLAFDDPGSAMIINRWVEQTTDGMVAGIIDKIPRATVAYLVNAVYFDGAWKYAFDVGQTRPRPFTISDGSEIMCQMMSSSKLLVPYLQESELGFEAVEFPFGNGNFVATIILPQPGSDLDTLIAFLNATNWNLWSDRFQTTALSLQFPKFKLESNILLNDALTSMGMGIAFDGRRADFSKMSEPGTKDLWINRVMHKAVIDVSEKGTEAGAGTVVEFKKGPMVKSLTVDRPFLFMVREVDSEAVLFLARVVNPSA